ncbi:heavy metal-associated isoprenylated plant protein 43-like [Diospyros lotus]|uniref:heavy metal-associated isoprenylated plant protein 43-like n=1 Tax=Diospyros lotus TaxID=55363 RepID=UPI00224E9750|nr:heavy metal-associated isoprenylated plant protein 43-like [Diospyros lotus]
MGLFRVCRSTCCSYVSEQIVTQKTVLKVSIHSQCCKTRVLKAVGKFTGIEQVSVDDVKGMLTVVGKVDAIKLTKQVRKTGKVVEIISVGPPKPDPPPPKPPKKPEPPKPLPPVCHCKECQLVAVSFVPYYGPSCAIL